MWITVQPLLGIEGDPMRLLFERDLTPHPQYCAAYEYMRLDEKDGGFGAQAVIHLGKQFRRQIDLILSLQANTNIL